MYTINSTDYRMGRMVMKKTQHVVKQIEYGSIAQEMGIEPGDCLVAVNGQEIQDIFDYRYLVQDDYIEVLVRRQTGKNGCLRLTRIMTMT